VIDAFYIACRNGELAIAQLLLANGADRSRQQKASTFGGSASSTQFRGVGQSLGRDRMIARRSLVLIVRHSQMDWRVVRDPHHA
jgi:hypothetical protein